LSSKWSVFLRKTDELVNGVVVVVGWMSVETHMTGGLSLVLLDARTGETPTGVLGSYLSELLSAAQAENNPTPIAKPRTVPSNGTISVPNTAPIMPPINPQCFVFNAIAVSLQARCIVLPG
jgi:hypothetical protein